MIGTRLDWNSPGNHFDTPIFIAEAMYGKDKWGIWWIRVPGVGFSQERLVDHGIVEHEDGTITVTPVIVAKGFDPSNAPIEWHGFLEAGVWRSS